MSKFEIIRAYATEPILSACVLLLLMKLYGANANAAFMHDEARDILSLCVVLLGAALALWIGLFWISSSDFGQWLSSRQMLAPTNTAYVASTAILLLTCVFCILCAHVSVLQVWLQIIGEFFFLWALATLASLLNNTRCLLVLHGEYERQHRISSKISNAAK